MAAVGLELLWVAANTVGLSVLEALSQRPFAEAAARSAVVAAADLQLFPVLLPVLPLLLPRPSCPASPSSGGTS